MSKFRIRKETRELTGICYINTYTSISSDNNIHQLPLGVPFAASRERHDPNETREQPEQRQCKYHHTLLLFWYETRAKDYSAKGTPDINGKWVFRGIVFPPVVALECPGDDGLDVRVDTEFFQVFAVFRDGCEAPHGAIGGVGTRERSKEQFFEFRHRLDKSLEVFVGEFVRASAPITKQPYIQPGQLV
jgi:hypothetical protein